MNAQGLTFFLQFWIFCLVFICVKGRMNLRDLLHATMTSGPISGEIPKPKTTVRHHCRFPSCVYIKKAGEYREVETVESFWMDHYLNFHNTIAPNMPYTEVVHADS